MRYELISCNNQTSDIAYAGSWQEALTLHTSASAKGQQAGWDRIGLFDSRSKTPYLPVRKWLHPRLKSELGIGYNV